MYKILKVLVNIFGNLKNAMAFDELCQQFSYSYGIFIFFKNTVSNSVVHSPF
jgi:hypothetical protein